MSTPEELAAQIRALSAPDRLRLAADLMEQRRGDLAWPIIREVSEALGAVILLAKMGGPL